jgi:hypothetical protein
MFCCCTSKSSLISTVSPGNLPSILEVASALERANVDGAAPKEELAVKVVIRVRPFLSREERVSCVEPTGSSSLKIQRGRDEAINFSFDGVLGAPSSQQDCFFAVALGVLTKCLAGYNGCVFAYGQTGSGKTFAMEGSAATAADAGGGGGGGGGGIIPQLASSLFRPPADNGLLSLDVAAEYLEIYQERLVDLLDSEGGGEEGLSLRQKPSGEIFVEGSTQRSVARLDDLQRLLAEGSSKRTRGETNMNALSSRSHAVLTLRLTMVLPDGVPRTSKLHLIDLAGSERADATGATGARLKEGAQINKSLSALGGVISALTTPGRPHIPYRDSKLTRLLQDSLGGNAVTAMLCCVSPAVGSYDETLSSLRFAERAKRVRNVATQNVDPAAAKLAALERQLRAAVEKNGLLEAALARRLALPWPLPQGEGGAAARGALDEELARTRMAIATAKGGALPALAAVGGASVGVAPNPAAAAGAPAARRNAAARCCIA